MITKWGDDMLASALVFHHHLGGSRNKSGEKELQEKAPQLHVNNTFEKETHRVQRSP